MEITGEIKPFLIFIREDIYINILKYLKHEIILNEWRFSIYSDK